MMLWNDVFLYALAQPAAASKKNRNERKALFFLSICIRSFEMMRTMFFHLLQIGAACRCTIDRWRLTSCVTIFESFPHLESCASLDSIAGIQVSSAIPSLHWRMETHITCTCFGWCLCLRWDVWGEVSACAASSDDLTRNTCVRSLFLNYYYLSPVQHIHSFTANALAVDAGASPKIRFSLSLNRHRPSTGTVN